MSAPEDELEFRHLMYHAESDCLYEDWNPATVAQALDSGEVDDVTDTQAFEERFKRGVGI